VDYAIAAGWRGRTSAEFAAVAGWRCRTLANSAVVAEGLGKKSEQSDCLSVYRLGFVVVRLFGMLKPI
jgi:hypothetical protein